MGSSTLSQVNVEIPSATVAGVFTVADGIIFVIIFILICYIVWLSNHEIVISRAQIQIHEKLLEPERTALEKKLAERTSEFVRAEEQRMFELQRNSEFGKLSRGLFHDLIGPLSSVSLYAQQLETSHMYPDETRKIIGTVIDSSRRMNSFMESVRRTLGDEIIVPQTISNNKPNFGMITDNMIEADLKREIDIMLDILGYKARMAGVEIKVEIDKKKSVYLPIHPVRLHQLILNLVSNAIDACIQKSSSIERSVHTDQQENFVNIVVTDDKIHEKSVIRLSISDTGCGISIENQERLFKKQFTTKKSGSGIGMMTIKTIVEKDLRGTIEVNSEEEKGTEFIIRIPIL